MHISVMWAIPDSVSVPRLCLYRVGPFISYVDQDIDNNKNKLVELSGLMEPQWIHVPLGRGLDFGSGAGLL